jgi:glyceraldehyde 3-phosphate dehydrogenase
MELMNNSETVDTAVNGFGRIGIPYTRIALNDDVLEVKAINGGRPNAAHDVAVLLEMDSIHGYFRDQNFFIENAEDSIVVDEKRIAIHGFRNLADAPWREVSDKLVVIESTGAFTKRDQLRAHINAGAKRVVLSSPTSDETIPTIVRGVNDTEENLSAIDDIVSTSSCSTNCIAPIMKVLGDSFDVRYGDAKIPHAFTNSQRSLDGVGNSTSKRRSNLAMIPASTGSAKEVRKLMPELDYFNAESMRVPISVGSVAMLTIGIRGSVSALDVTEVLQEASETSHKGIIGFSRRGMFSDRAIGQSYSSIIDPRLITDNQSGEITNISLQAWFDNEMGYANRVAEIAKRVGQLI